ncbi:MAG: NAD(P)-binding protein [Acidobacteriota bacterium]|nr:NAD(P)-binding protein [Acidobacteriota bacterium]
MGHQLHVGIVGGSIAGCSAAILLERAGHRVTVFERSAQGLVGRGGGIGTTAEVVDSLVADDLVDADFARVAIGGLAFTAGRSAADRLGVCPWQMPMDFRAFHWNTLWHNLRKRVPDACYRRGHEVTGIVSHDSTGTTLRLADGSEHDFDLALFADGYQSLGRATLFPDAGLAYRGYLLWRGLLPESEMDDPDPVENRIVRLSYLGMPGDLVVYFVPSQSGSIKKGERLFNWAAYVPLPESELPAFMVDKLGRPRTGAIPPGRMRIESEHRLKAMMAEQLPAYFSDIIGRTRDTYVQLIYNVDLPAYARGRVALIGDAGMVVQPFTGSGVFKGMNNVRDLLTAMAEAESLDAALSRWSVDQVRRGRRLLALAAQMEQALIWNRLDFTTADAATTAAWWRAAVTWPEEFSLEKR